MSDDEPFSSTLPRRQLGRALREARQGAGFTLEQAAQEMEVGKTTVIRIEKGQNEKVRLRDVEGFGKLYELDEQHIQELKDLAKQSATKSWWVGEQNLLQTGFATYLGLETGASRLQLYHPVIIPGLLQVAEYVRGIERPRLNTPSDTPEEIERRVELRLRRAAILTRRHKPLSAEFIIHESVLHTLVNSRAVMAKQCRHIADMSTRPNVTVRILPFTAGFPGSWIPLSPYIILDFPSDSREFGSEPPVVFTETTAGTMFFEEKSDVQMYRDIHDDLRCGTLDEQQSRDLLRQLARRYEK